MPEETSAPAVDVNHVAQPDIGAGQNTKPSDLNSSPPDIARASCSLVPSSEDCLYSVPAWPHGSPHPSGGSAPSLFDMALSPCFGFPATPSSDDSVGKEQIASFVGVVHERLQPHNVPANGECGVDLKTRRLERNDSGKRRSHDFSRNSDNITSSTCSQDVARVPSGTNRGDMSLAENKPKRDMFPTCHPKPMSAAPAISVLRTRPTHTIGNPVDIPDANAVQLASFAAIFPEPSGSEIQRPMSAPSSPVSSGEAGGQMRRIRSAQALVCAFGRAFGVRRWTGENIAADRSDCGGRGLQRAEPRRERGRTVDSCTRRCAKKFSPGIDNSRISFQLGNRHSAPNELTTVAFSIGSTPRPGCGAGSCRSSPPPETAKSGTSTLLDMYRVAEHSSHVTSEQGKANGEDSRRSQNRRRPLSLVNSISRGRPFIQVNHETQLAGSSFAQKKWWILENWELDRVVDGQEAVDALRVADLPNQEKKGAANERMKSKAGDIQMRNVTSATAGHDDAGRLCYMHVNLASLSAREIRRQEAIFELIATERDYVRDLKLVDKYYIQRIRRRELMDPRSIQRVFSNMESLISLNDELLQAMEKRRREGRGVVKELADIFLNMAQYFKMYTIYCGNHTRALEHLTELLEKRSNTGSQLTNSGVLPPVQENAKVRESATEFESFLRVTASMPCMRNLDLQAYLLQPVQRLCKYPLLLKEILKHTEDSESDDGAVSEQLTEHREVAGRQVYHCEGVRMDCESLRMRRALETVNSVVEAVNESSRQVEEMERTVQFWESVQIDWSLLPADTSRQILHHGDLLKACLTHRQGGRCTSQATTSTATISGQAEPNALFITNTCPSGSLTSRPCRLSRRIAILFSDCLVLAKPRSRGARIMFSPRSRDPVKKGAKLVVRAVLRLAEYDVRNLEDTATLQNAIELYPVFSRTHFSSSAKEVLSPFSSPVVNSRDVPTEPRRFQSLDDGDRSQSSSSSLRNSVGLDVNSDQFSSVSSRTSSSLPITPRFTPLAAPVHGRRTAAFFSGGPPPGPATLIVCASSAEEKTVWLSKILPAMRVFRLQQR